MIEFFLDNLNYWTILLGMMIESSFIPFPSEIIVPPAAWLALGADSDMNIVMVVIVATLGADLGALINYFLAKWLGRPIVYKFADSRVGHLCLLNGEKVAHAEEYFRKHGIVSTFFGRLVPAVRQLISIPAGLAKMKLHTFLLFTTLGACLWNIVLAILGWVIRKSFPEVQTTEDVSRLASTYSHEIGYGIAIILLACIIYFVVKRVIKKRKTGKTRNPKA